MLARIRKSMEEKDQGFTLIELLVVIIIIGILAAIAIPVFLNQRKKGFDAQAKSDARNLATLEETYFTDHNNYYVEGTVAAVSNVITLVGLTDYKNSAGVTSVTVYGYSTPAGGAAFPAKADVTTKAATTATGGYCIEADSQSGNTFVYDSTKGGLQSGTSAKCG